MRHITTLSDFNYLSQGLALLQSLEKSSVPYTVHYLCLDDKTFEYLQASDNKNVIPYLYSWIGLEELRESNYPDYCYTLASYFTRLIVVNELNMDSICYIDSDVFFQKDIGFLYKALGDAEVGIFSHLQFTKEMNRSEGLYNCGVVYFAGVNGFRVLDWWANAVLAKEPKNLATCGDQRFLEMFPKLSDKVSIDCVKHGAQWEWQMLDIDELKGLCFVHFSKFKWNEQNYEPSTQHQIYTSNETVMKTPELKAIFDNYYSVVKSFKIW